MNKKVAKHRPVRKRNAAARAIGNAVLTDLKEFAEALEAGIALESKYTIRQIEVPDSPAEYTARAIRATRDKIGVSQSVFAHLLGVSTILVQAWEQGNRIAVVGTDDFWKRSTTIQNAGGACRGKRRRNSTAEAAGAPHLPSHGERGACKHASQTAC